MKVEQIILHKWIDNMTMDRSGICGQRRPIATYASAQSDQGPLFPLKESLNILIWPQIEPDFFNFNILFTSIRLPFSIYLEMINNSYRYEFLANFTGLKRLPYTIY